MVDYQLAVRGNLVIDVEPPTVKKPVYRRKPSDDDWGNQKGKAGTADDGGKKIRRGSVVSQNRTDLAKILGASGIGSSPANDG